MFKWYRRRYQVYCRKYPLHDIRRFGRNIPFHLSGAIFTGSDHFIAADSNFTRAATATAHLVDVSLQLLYLPFASIYGGSRLLHKLVESVSTFTLRRDGLRGRR